MLRNVGKCTEARQFAARASEILRASDLASSEGRHKAAETLLRRLDAVDMETSFHPVDAPEAALHQAMILHGAIDVIASWSGEDGEQHAELAQRLVVNLVRFIEREFSLNREDLAFDYYLPKELERDAFGEPAAKSVQ